MTTKYKVIIGSGIALMIFATATATTLAYLNSPKRQTPLVFSDKEMLANLWQAYKKQNLEPGTYRTLDKSQNNLTTSEGEGYTMLRSTWQDDQSTFDHSLQWTKDNLQRPDHLLSWKFGEQPNGKYGILTAQGGNNTASDGDTNVALSLVMAYSRWNQSHYLYDAKPIIDSIWQKEVVMIKGKPVLTADNLEASNKTAVEVNPSYLEPYAYKIFAKVDKSHDWSALANNSYTILSNLSSSKLDKSNSAGLPPDWIKIDRQTGQIQASTTGGTDSNFGYDAMRVPWQMALDYAWFKDPRDKQILSNYSFLKTQWQSKHRLASIYSHDGSVVSASESPAIYGGDMGYFVEMDSRDAKAIYQTKLLPLYNPNTQSWKSPPGYYNDNWVWFGMALYQNALPNLTATKT